MDLVFGAGLTGYTILSILTEVISVESVSPSHRPSILPSPESHFGEATTANPVPHISILVKCSLQICRAFLNVAQPSNTISTLKFMLKLERARPLRRGSGGEIPRGRQAAKRVVGTLVGVSQCQCLSKINSKGNF
ncbi:hypothetical protein F4776DRAFT_668204 [Hypoxylon sp. NC0597]|nr:hypothetical protein F4776DRAFT_668204 [Hypoxylon sp. NC0597]